LASFSCQ